MPEARHDPFLNFNFTVEIDQVTVAGFEEVDLPDAQIEFSRYREGTDRVNSGRLLPGRVDYGPLVLRRGFDADRTLFQWWSDVAEGNVERRNVSVILRNQSGQPIARWNFRNALPTKYSAPSFRARGNDVAVESLELTVEGMELAD
jgi:phage tail-like protein